MLPANCCKSITDSSEYIEPSNCNLLGVSTQVAVPRPSTDILRVDMLHGVCILKTLEQLPRRCKFFCIVLIFFFLN